MFQDERDPFVHGATLANICRAVTLRTPSNAYLHGYKPAPDASLIKTAATLPVSLFVPRFFPIEQAQRRPVFQVFNWADAPKECTFIIVVSSEKRFEGETVFQHTHALRESCEDERRQKELICDTALFIRQSVDHLRDVFDLRSVEMEISLEMTGFSQGGAVAAAATLSLIAWAQDSGLDLYCTTFDSPGIHSCHLHFTLRDKDFWERHVTNFVGDPNPVNMLNQHFGRTIHLRSRLQRELENWKWSIRCVMLDVLRVAGMLLFAHYSVCDWIAPLYMRTPICTFSKTIKHIVSVLLLSLTWMRQKRQYSGSFAVHALQTILGKTREEIEESHSLDHVLESLQRCRERSEEAVEMSSWPGCDAVEPSGTEQLFRLILMMLPFWTTNAGMLYAKNRQQLIYNRMTLLKGYQPKHDAFWND